MKNSVFFFIFIYFIIYYDLFDSSPSYSSSSYNSISLISSRERRNSFLFAYAKEQRDECGEGEECDAGFDDEFAPEDDEEADNVDEIEENGENEEMGEEAEEQTEAIVKVPKHANEHGKPIDVDAAKCFDRHPEHCSRYANDGECTKNPGWMIVNCPISCDSCHLLDPKVRCARENLNMTLAPAYAPGDQQRIFENMISAYDSKFGVTVLSTDPWIVTFDNFMTDEEVEALISTVEGTWERSTDTGTMNAFGEAGRVLSQSRTSSNAWCRSKCESHPKVDAITKKIEEITQVRG